MSKNNLFLSQSDADKKAYSDMMNAALKWVVFFPW